MARGKVQDKVTFGVPADFAGPRDEAQDLGSVTGVDRVYRQRLLATVLKVVLRLVPTNCHTVIQTTATSAAINPYSMAVTPASSLASCRTRLLRIVISLNISGGMGNIDRKS